MLCAISLCSPASPSPSRTFLHFPVHCVFIYVLYSLSSVHIPCVLANFLCLAGFPVIGLHSSQSPSPHLAPSELCLYATFPPPFPSFSRRRTHHRVGPAHTHSPACCSYFSDTCGQCSRLLVPHYSFNLHSSQLFQCLKLIFFSFPFSIARVAARLDPSAFPQTPRDSYVCLCVHPILNLLSRALFAEPPAVRVH